MIEYHPQTNPSKTPIFSIIIPTWNNLDYLKNCIKAIFKNSTLDLQIVLHINEGKDGTIEWAKENGIDFTLSKENVGVCLACNSAFHLTKADYIVFLNDDMYVLPDWDINLLKGIQEIGHTDFYASSTLIEPYETNNHCVLAPYNFGETLQEFKEEALVKVAKSLIKEDWNGSTWPPSVLHRSTWHKIGGYSIEFFPGYYSDPDISAKLWNIGIREFKGIGNSLVYHFMSKSTTRFKKKTGYNTFVRKWGMTARFFTQNFLKISTPYQGRLPEFTNQKVLQKEQFRSKLKTLLK